MGLTRQSLREAAISAASALRQTCPTRPRAVIPVLTRRSLFARRLLRKFTAVTE
ncbi:hypothetical protein VSX61_17060 [Brenneria populi subsp. brevivirga]|uniref:hypothetical protein n=1 Tax=Brenneria populi TaxID=1505588 RepID=UPI002E178E9E|nr:hypothetical protein [Brenneria populi subsp. brevivirga]